MSETIGKQGRRIDRSDPDIPIPNYNSRFKDRSESSRRRRTVLALGGVAATAASLMYPEGAKDTAVLPLKAAQETADALGVIRHKISDELQERSRPEVGNVRYDGKQWVEMNGKEREMGEYMYKNVSLHPLARETLDSDSEFPPVIVDSLKSDRRVVSPEELQKIGIDINDPETRVQGKKVWGDTYNGEIIHPDGSRENMGTVEVNGDYYGKYLKMIDEDGNTIAYIPEIFVSYSDNPKDHVLELNIQD